MFDSRDDYARVIKMLLLRLRDGTGVELVGDTSDPRVHWTDRELERADRYQLDVTQRPGAWASYDDRLRPELELRLVADDGWDPSYAADVDDPNDRLGRSDEVYP